MINSSAIESAGELLMSIFDRAYVINLPARKDRRRRITSELRRIGLDFGDRIRLFSAVQPTDAGGFQNIGMRGCFLSHLSILREAIDLGLNSILVLEDDLVLAHNFRYLVPPVAAALGKDPWDLIYFGYVGEVEPSIGPLRRCNTPLCQTHFYGIREPGLSLLCNYLTQVIARPAGHLDGGPMSPDGAFNMFRQRNPSFVSLVSIPVLGIQGPSASDIAGYRWFDKVPLLKQAATLGRQLKLRRVVR